MAIHFSILAWRIPGGQMSLAGYNPWDCKESDTAEQLTQVIVLFFVFLFQKHGFPGGPDGKESSYNAGDPGSIPGSGRSPGDGTGYPLQYLCLENSMDWGAWQAVVHWVAESDTTEQLTLSISGTCQYWKFACFKFFFSITPRYQCYHIFFFMIFFKQYLIWLVQICYWVQACIVHYGTDQ